MKYRVVVVSPGYASYDVEREILEPLGAELVLAHSDYPTEDDVISMVEDADAILVREAPVTARVIEALRKCRIIARYGVGVDNIDLETAKKRGIYVTNVPDYGNEEVSDHAAALLMACIRTIVLRDRRLRSGESDIRIDEPIYRTTGKVLGLIGYGKIARAWEDGDQQSVFEVAPPNGGDIDEIENDGGERQGG